MAVYKRLEIDTQLMPKDPTKTISHKNNMSAINSFFQPKVAAEKETNVKFQ